jgi:RimJ/RimL family protein N-acetyltransferase
MGGFSSLMPLSDVTTPRLRLTRWEPALHTPALEAINAFPEAVTYLNDGVPYTPAETAVQSARLAAHWEQHGFGLWAATVAASGDAIGFVGLSHPLWFPERADEFEVGWRLHPRAWGNGYATEGGRAALQSAWAELRLERVIAVIDPDNAPSLAVAERLGMTREARVPHPQRPGSVDIYVAVPPANDSR